MRDLVEDTALAADGGAPVGPPLVVDLDGTLIRTDLLVESFLSLAGADPRDAMRAIFALRHGKAAMKAAIADAALIDVATLPFDEAVLAFIAEQRAIGRPVVLASASDRRYVEAVAEHLGLFDTVLGSEGGVNLSGVRKADRLVALYGEGGFDYIGDAAVDCEVWSRARRAYAKAPSKGLARTIARKGVAAETIGERSGGLRHYIKALRPHQWLKNVLVFAPALGAHAFSMLSLLACVAAFVSFSLCASSVYLLNDLLDLRNDRDHARKRKRPFASGAVPLAHGILMVPALLLIAVGIGAFLPFKFLLGLMAYWVLTTSYSFKLKRVVMIDVIVLACLYGARILAGSLATGIALSPWLGALSVFVFTSLALIKRCTELVDRIAAGKGDPKGRGYQLADLPILEAMAAAAGFVAVLVLALYLNSPDVNHLYRYPHRLWLLCVVVLYWISRILIKAHRGEMHDDPVVFAVRDRVSQICGLISVAVVGFSL